MNITIIQEQSSPKKNTSAHSLMGILSYFYQIDVET